MSGNDILDVPFDQYQRYKTASIIINDYRSTGQKFSILEIGANEHRNLEIFLPEDDIKYLDIKLSEKLQKNKKFILADATNMPEIATDSFDLIVALDVFEHIPKLLRENFLKELNRVSKHMIVLSAPFDNKNVQDCEFRVNEYFKIKFGKDYIWLEEHMLNGLPNLNETIEIFNNLKDRKLTYFKHGSLFLWEKLIRVHFEVADNSLLQNYRQNLDYYYNKNMFLSDIDENCYRDFLIYSNKVFDYKRYFDKSLKSKEIIDTLSDLMDSIYRLSFEKKFLNINAKNEQIQTREEQIQEKERQIQKKEQQIQEKNKELEDKEQYIQNQNMTIVHWENVAQSMRIKNRIKGVIKKVFPSKFWNIMRYVRYNPCSIKHGIYVLKNQGLKSLLSKISKADSLPLSVVTYQYKEPSFTSEIKRTLNNFHKKPLISIIMPVYNVDTKWLKLAIQSIEVQWYTNWELCIADDKSTNIDTLEYLRSLHNDKIKIIFLKNNVNISVASNEAAKLATGEYIVLLDNDDELTPDALYEIVKVINQDNPDFIYSDEDKLELNGTHSFPFFKPDFSYDLLLSLNYITHLAIIKKELFDKISGFNIGVEGAQDHDLFLRIVEQTNKIVHIPKVLYHWRMIETSTAKTSHAKPYAHNAAKIAIQNHLNRTGTNGVVINSGHTFVFDINYNLPQSQPLVSIIIPTKDGIDFLDVCINSILELSTYANYEIIILNNNSTQDETFDWFDRIQKLHSNINIIEANYKFNWSKLNNHGIKESNGDVYIFLNNDIKVITKNWIERLVSRAMQPKVGTVGALLLFEDDTIQHAGVVVGMNGWADHVYRETKQVHMHSPYVSPMVTRNVLASTGACLAISKSTIDDIGGFDENFIICGSDVEISLRAYDKGYRNIYDGNTKLYHYESKTRDSFVPECDFVLSKKAYQAYWKSGDPFYNKNLTLDSVIPTFKGNL